MDGIKSHEVKEAVTQTSFQEGRPVQEKFIQTENTPCTCACSLVLVPKIEEMSKKLELLIAKETQYTLLTTPDSAKFELNNQDCEYAGSFSPPQINLDNQEPGASKIQEQQSNESYDAEQVTTVDLHELPVMSISNTITPPSACLPTHTRPALFEETYKESSSMANYAKNLVFKIFAKHELQGSNCSGMKGKKSLEKDKRMNVIKEATFKKYPVEDQKRSWSLRRKAIDSAIRHCKHFI